MSEQGKALVAAGTRMSALAAAISVCRDMPPAVAFETDWPAVPRSDADMAEVDRRARLYEDASLERLLRVAVALERYLEGGAQTPEGCPLSG